MTSEPVSKAFNAAVMTITNRLLPRGYDVSENAPSTFPALLAHYERTGRICVWNGASENTIFGDPEINFAFRAWHDSKHILYRLPFSFEGESAVCRLQQADIRALYSGETADYFCKLLDAEVIGQVSYYRKYKRFPENQRQFALDWLESPEKALECSYDHE